ncbi:phage tail sheath family protein [Archangium violaceum]|uniref:Tail protein n=1 Tax=Archangium violaceum Cb vi76 TaxID=1406225 RepID=A0A084T0V2_9BACT|nr:phage tail sheath subtilisin-like domain-containing protein [Archangium violaceum]KFA94337.1 tail protein [Archangium violaceum Cb vi76]
MPEYLAPGVFVEETSFRSKSIEGVSTTTTGFIGPTRYGPVELENELITSLGEFERTYGSRQQLGFGTDKHHNYMWHAVRAFFEEGGKRLYISRVFHPTEEGDQKARYTGFDTELAVVTTDKPSYKDGYARTRHPATPTLASPRYLFLAARYPGASGNMRVRITLNLGQNILSYNQAGEARVGALQDRDVVFIHEVGAEAAGDFYQANLSSSGAWTFTPTDTAKALKLTSLNLTLPTPTEEGEGGGEGGGGEGGEEEGEAPPRSEIHVITATVSLLPTIDSETSLVWSELALDSKHQRAGTKDALKERFLVDPQDLSRNREIPVVIELHQLVKKEERTTGQRMDDWNGLDLLHALKDQAALTQLKKPDATDEERSVNVLLAGGNDGIRPTEDDYKGWDVPSTTRKTGLKQFEDLEDISIVAAPGSTFGYETGPGPSVVSSLISHCERMRYRIAVLDSGNDQTLQQVREMRAKFDSSYAALYYPWVKVMDPVTRQPIVLPPSGFVAGIYARNDVRRAVYKAPANEVVTTALGFESILNTAQQEAINPEGINAFRFFEGRGLRLWGARTISSDPEWKYVNLRRYFAYLERSIDKGTQWAVFEPNGPQLWANVRRSIEDFLLNEWQSGALLGDRPDAAYFVKCDRSTMTQNDLDNGRLICLVGVAPLRPAEFVVIRIGQWTGDRK